MKIIFAGTPTFAAIALDALIHSPHEILAVLTQPDRPAGRGLKLTQSPVKELALKHGYPLFQPLALKDKKEQESLASFNADVMVVAAYGMLLPKVVLSIPRFGCINIHPSLLPRFRGAAPIPRTILAGDILTGVTIMQMDEGLDTGPILLQHQYALDPDETAQSLHDKLAVMGANSLLEVLDLLDPAHARGTALTEQQMIATPQDNSLATYANKISKEEARIDWQKSAIEIERAVRAFNPWPVAHTNWRGQTLRIWQAKTLSEDSYVVKDHQEVLPGTIFFVSEKGIDVTCGQGILRLLKLQLPGGKVLIAADFYNARRAELITGQQFS